MKCKDCDCEFDAKLKACPQCGSQKAYAGAAPMPTPELAAKAIPPLGPLERLLEVRICLQRLVDGGCADASATVNELKRLIEELDGASGAVEKSWQRLEAQHNEQQLQEDLQRELHRTFQQFRPPH